MITIKKAKITSIGYLEVEYEKQVQGDNGKPAFVEVAEKPKWDPHSDLLNCFSALRIHLVRLCEQAKEIPSDEESYLKLLSDFKVTGFVIGGHDEHEGVTLIGRKALKNNRVLNLNSPFTKWEDEHNGYSEAYDLNYLIGQCQDEVTEYLSGKKAPSPQTELEFEEETTAVLAE